MGIAAQKNDWDLSGTTARSEKHMSAVPRRRIERVTVNIRVPRSFDETTRRKLEEVARTCPVAESIKAGVEIDLSFEWGGS